MNKSGILASALLFSVLSVSNPAAAEPQGGQVRSGSATIQQTLGTTTIQQLTDKAIIDWHRFNIAPNELVKFVQPSEMAVILNRVTGGDPSVIMGKLQANGQLFLVNPNGILFGPQSQVDVGSLVATTLSISNQDFLNGNYHFVQDSNFNLASVVNQGTITISDEGYCVLTAPLVSNEGLIVANLGKVALGAGNEVTLNLDGRNLVSYQLSASPSEGGTVVLTPDAVSNVLQGVVQDGGLVPAGSIQEENGQIKLVGAEGTLVQAGTIEAGSVETHSSQVSVLTRGSTTAAGEVKALGRNVVMQGTIDASGANGGGTVLVGGPASGVGPEEHAVTTRVEGDIFASATEQGDGGTIVVWSDERTDITSTLTALGAGEGSKGGFVETSSKQDIYYTGLVQAGAGGTWLIDPGDVTIVDVISGSNPNEFATTGVGGINATLDAGTSVPINANSFSSPGNGTITQLDGATITKSAGGNATLTLIAGSPDGGIFLQDDIISTSGTLDVVLTAGASGSIEVGDIVTNNGNLTVTSGGTFIQDAGQPINAGTGTVQLTAAQDISLDDLRGGAVTLTSTGGAIETNFQENTPEVTANTLTMTAATGIGTLNGGLDIDVNTLTNASSTNGDIGLNNTAGPVTMTSVTASNGSLDLVALGGNLTITSASSAGANKSISITTDTGNIVGGNINANGNPITIVTGGTGTVNGDITADGADFLASDLTITSNGAIGDAATLDFNATNVVMTVAAAGGITANDTGGGANYATATTSNGSIALTATGGVLTAGNVIASTAGGVGNVTLTSTGANNDVLLGDVRALGDSITVTSAGAIEESGTDPNSELTSTNLTMTAANGIGAAAQLEIDAVNLLNTMSTTGAINLNDTASGLTVGQTGGTNGVTGAGSISLTATSGNLIAHQVISTGSAVTLATSATGLITVDAITASTSIAVTTPTGGTLNEVGAGDAGADLIAPVLSLTVSAGIGNLGTLEIAANSVTATSSSGAIDLADTGGGLTLTNVSTTGNITVTTTGGDLIATSVTSTGSSTFNLSTTSTGNIQLGLVSTGSTGTVNLNSVGTIQDNTPGDASSSLTTGTANLVSVGGIGTTDQVELNATTLNASATGAGLLNILDTAGGLVANTVTTTNGSITLATTGGSLTLNTVTAAGAGSNVTATSSANLNVDNVTATNIATLTASGGAVNEQNTDAGADVTAATINLSGTSSVGNLGTLEVQATTLSINSGTGLTNVADVDTLNVLSATSNGGAITLAALAGNLDATSVVASGTAGINLSATGGDVRLGDVQAVGDAVTISGTRIEELGNDGGADLVSGTATLTASTGIGSLGSLEVDLTTLTAATLSGIGNLDINDVAGGITVTNAQTFQGNLTLAAADGKLTVTAATAGSGGTGAGNIALSTTGITTPSDVEAGNVTAAGDNINVTSVARIEEIGADGAADLSAANIILQAATAIGATGSLEVDATTGLTADVSGAGLINVLDTAGGLNATSVTTANGSITLSATTGNLLATSVVAGGTGANITLSTVGVSGNVLVDSVVAAGDTVTLTSVGLIDRSDADAGPDITANALSITAAPTGVGVGGALEVDVATFSTGTIAAGGVNVHDQAGGLTVTSLTSTTGTVSLSATAGNLQVDTLAANGTGTLNLSTTTSGNILLGAVTAAGTATVNSAGNIGETGADLGAVDLTAATLVLNAVTGVGSSSDPLDINATTAFTGAVSGAGDLFVSDTFGGLAVTNATTANGSIGLSATSGVLAVTAANTAGTGDITLSTISSGALNVDNVVATGRTITVTSSAAIEELGNDAGADLTATTLLLTAGTGIGVAGTLEINATNLTAAGGGSNVFLSDTAGGLTVTSATTTTGGITLDVAAGDLTATSIAPSAGRNVTLTTTSGNILVGLINAAGGTVILNSSGNIQDVGNDAGTDVIATNLTLTSGTGIGVGGNFDIDATTLTSATVSGAGNIDLADAAGGLTVTNATTTNGSITVAATIPTTGTLLVTNMSAVGGAINLSTATAGDVSVANLVSTAGVTINAFAGITESGVDTNADITGTVLNLQAGTGIGAAATVEIDGTSLTANVTGAGLINLQDTVGGLVVTSANTSNGAITLQTVGGDLTLTSVSAGTNGLVTLSTTGAPAGNVLVNSVTTGGNIAITSVGAVDEAGTDGTADLTAVSLSISSATGIGAAGDLEIDVTTLTSATATAGNISLDDLSGGLALTTVTATNGDIDISAAGGALNATTVTSSGASRDIRLSTIGSGTLSVGNVTSADEVLLTSAGSIEELAVVDGTADVTGTNLTFNAATGIGTVDALEVQGTSLTALVSGTGAISLADTTGGLVLTDVETVLGNINVTATTGNLTATLVRASTGGGVGNVTLTTLNSGGILVDDVQALGDTITLSSATLIDESGADAGADLNATSLALTASSGGIGAAGQLEVTAVNLAATSTLAINVQDTGGGLNVTNASASNGDITLSTSGGDLNAVSLNAAGSARNLTLTTQTSGNIVLGTAAATGAATLTSAGAILESPDDPGAELTALSATLQAATTIGAAGDVLDVSLTTLTNATAGGLINLNDITGGLTVTAASTSAGALSIQATGGALTVTTATAAGGNLTLINTGSGALTLDNVSAVGNSVILSSFGSINETGAGDVGADITAATADLTAGSSVGNLPGALEVAVTNLSVVVTTGSINIADLSGGLTVTNATTGGGAITLTTDGGNLTLTNLVANGATSNVILSTTTSGDVLVANVDATGDNVTITSAGSIDSLVHAGADISGAAVTLTSVDGINTELAATTATASVTGAGNLILTDVGGLTVNSATTADGAINLSVSGGTLTATTVTAGGAVNGDVTLTTLTSGSILVGAVTANGGTATVTSAGTIDESTGDPSADLIANAMTLTAVSGVGVGPGLALETQGDSLNATTQSGNLTIANTGTATTANLAVTTGLGSITLTQTATGILNVTASTVDGSVTVSSNNDIQLPSIVAGGVQNVSVTSTGATSDLFVGQITAAGDTVTLTAGGSVDELGADGAADITSANLAVTSTTGIGGGGAVEIDATTLTNATASVSGGIHLADTAGGLVVTSATTQDGSVTLSAAGGTLAAATVTAGGTGDITLSTTGSGDVTVNQVTAAADQITITAAGAIEENTPDVPADLTADTLVLTAATGIGAAGTLEVVGNLVTATTAAGNLNLTNAPTAASTLNAQITGAGTLTYAQTGVLALTVTNATTGNGSITLSNGADLDAVNVVAGGAGNDVSITATGSGSDILAGLVSAADLVTLNAAAAINESGSDAGSDITGATLSLSSASGIGSTGTLEINATSSLTAATTVNGAIDLLDTAGGLVVTSATSVAGAISLGAVGGNLDAQIVTAGGVANVNLSTTTSGNVLLGAITATTDNVIINSAGSIEENTADAAVDVTSNGLTLNAVSGAGVASTLEVAITTLDGDVTGVGGVFVTDGGGLTVTSLTTNDGAIAIVTDTGNLDAQTLTAGGTGRNITLTDTVSGNVLLGAVTASGDSITVNSAGQINESGNDATSDVTTNNLTLIAATGLGVPDTLEIGAVNLTATVTGAGEIDLNDRNGGVTVTSATTTNGSISLTATGGDLALTNVNAAGTGADVFLTTITSGNVLTNLVNAVDTITVNSAGAIEESGVDSTADMVAPIINLTSVTGTGAAALLKVDATTLTATNTGVGRIALNDATGGVTVTNATTADGEIRLSTNNATLDVTAASVGGNANLTLVSNALGNVRVGNVQAVGNQVLIKAAGTIEELGNDVGADITSSSINLDAATGIGMAGTLETDTVTAILLNVSGVGDIFLTDTAGNFIVTRAVTNNGDITLAATGANLVLTDVAANGTGNVVLTTITAGDIRLGVVEAKSNFITLNSAGNIFETTQDTTRDLTCNVLNITAVTGVGNNVLVNAVEVDTKILNASITGTGNLYLADTAGNINLNNVATANGEINITGVGTMIGTHSIAGGTGSDQRLTSTGSIKVNDVRAADGVFLTSGKSIAEVAAFDVGNDVTAGGNSEFRANMGVIGTTTDTAIEVSMTNATLSVLATGQVNGVSIQINGVVSPSNTLIKLNSPPGSVLFNGVVVP